MTNSISQLRPLPLSSLSLMRVKSAAAPSFNNFCCGDATNPPAPPPSFGTRGERREGVPASLGGQGEVMNSEKAKALKNANLIKYDIPLLVCLLFS